LGRDDWQFKIDLPANPHKPAYETLLEDLELLLLPHLLVAYHCTRLTPPEAVDIRSNGLRRLDAALVARKLDRCHAEGLMTEAVYGVLKSSPHIAGNLGNPQAQRAGHLCYCPNRSTLLKCGHVSRLFKSWGGEAIYWGHEDEPEIGQALKSIGTPCILRCHVPFSDSKHSRRFSDHFVAHLIRHEVEYPEPGPTFDFIANRDLAGTKVAALIGFSEAEFSTLTEYQSWPLKDQPLAGAS